MAKFVVVSKQDGTKLLELEYVNSDRFKFTVPDFKSPVDACIELDGRFVSWYNNMAKLLQQGGFEVHGEYNSSLEFDYALPSFNEPIGKNVRLVESYAIVYCLASAQWQIKQLSLASEFKHVVFIPDRKQFKNWRMLVVTDRDGRQEGWLFRYACIKLNYGNRCEYCFYLTLVDNGLLLNRDGLIFVGNKASAVLKASHPHSVTVTMEENPLITLTDIQLI